MLLCTTTSYITIDCHFVFTQLWLFGYELTDTLCTFCENEVHIVTSKKKVDFLQPVISLLEEESSPPKIVTHLRNKVPDAVIHLEYVGQCPVYAENCFTQEDADAGNFKVVCDALKSSKNVSTASVLFNISSFYGDYVLIGQ